MTYLRLKFSLLL